MANLLQSAGSSDSGSFAPIFTNRFFLGLWTNRSPLRGPSGVLYENFYHVGTDALIDGVNVEISNRLTICRRPGTTAGLSGVLSSATIPDVPDSFYSFHEITGTVRVLADTPSAPYLITAANVIPLFTKANGAGQSYFQGVGQSLYFSDLQEQKKWLDFGAGSAGNSFAAVTATSLTSNVATITAINNFAVGQTVVISGTTRASGAFNTTAVITVATPTFFQFALTHANVSSLADPGFASATWNWGIAAPTTAPTLEIVETAANATAWQANTFFSTMGILLDSNNNTQQLVSVNADGTNSTQFGLSSNGQPTWNQTPGGTTTDNGVTWTNTGPVGTWAAFHAYSNASVFGSVASPAIIYDTASAAYYIMINPQLATGTSGGTKPPFNGVPGTTYIDGSCKWACCPHSPNQNVTNQDSVWETWQQAYAYAVGNFLIEPAAPPTTQTIYAQRVTGAGTSAGSFTHPNWATAAGLQTQDNQLIWTCLGSGTWAAATHYNAWSAPRNPSFSCIEDSNGYLQVCSTTGISGATQPYRAWFATTAYATSVRIVDSRGNIQEVTGGGGGNSGGSEPTWNTTPTGTTADGALTWTNQGAPTTVFGWNTGYGGTTKDGTAIWTCVGRESAWASSKAYHLPLGAFSLPSTGNPYGGSGIVDSNGDIQFAVYSGLSGGSEPTWATAEHDITVDNQIFWADAGTPSANSLTWTKGFVYVYAYKARTAVDAYVTTAPPLWPTPLGSPLGSADGSVSTASPTASFASSNAGAVINITGIGSTDPQVDTISIFRTFDGGLTLFWLTDIPNPATVGGQPGDWFFQDYMTDLPSSDVLLGLNTLVLAPTAHSNDEPPAGFVNIVQHLGRIFGSVGATVYCSQGPSVGGASQPPGNGFTAFNPSNYWTFPSPVTKLVPIATGLLVHTTSDIFIIPGGPDTKQNIFLPGVGLPSYNALSFNGGIIFMMTADNQVISLDPTMGCSKIGTPVGDLFNAFTPANTYVTYHIQGANDDALYVADGSTGYLRGVPNPAPDASISGPQWSPKANLVGGCKAIASLEVAVGRHALLIGGATANQPILVRDSTYTVFTDNTVKYPASCVFGSMVLANPGQLAELGFITCEFTKTGTSPDVLVLLDEIRDTYMTISAASQSGSNTTYTYVLASGSQAPVAGITVTITGMGNSANNGVFEISSTGSGTFTVVNALGVTATTQTGVATRFENISDYVFSGTSLPPQDPPTVYGTTLAPSTIFSNRYYFEQSVGGAVPYQGTSCRHIQIKLDFGQADAVQNEILTLTVYGKHWQEDQ